MQWFSDEACNGNRNITLQKVTSDANPDDICFLGEFYRIQNLNYSFIIYYLNCYNPHSV